jgi:hypothetical protein
MYADIQYILYFVFGFEFWLPLKKFTSRKYIPAVCIILTWYEIAQNLKRL